MDQVEGKVAHLSGEYAAEVKHLFHSYPDVIAYSFHDVRPSKCKTRHRFELTSDEPIFLNLRRLPPRFNDIVKKEVDRMLTAGIITPVESSWTSPIVLVTKKDGRPRFCIDYSKLNAVMKRDRRPLPLIDEIFDEVRGSTVFTTFKRFQGYWKIKMHEPYKEMTNFICRYGTFDFEVMLFGLKNSGVTFQRMIDNLLANVSNVKCYADNVIVHSVTMEEHIKHLEKVMSLLRKHGLRARLINCFFMHPRVQLLGHIIDRYGVHIDEDKAQKIRDALSRWARVEAEGRQNRSWQRKRQEKWRKDLGLISTALLSALTAEFAISSELRKS